MVTLADHAALEDWGQWLGGAEEAGVGKIRNSAT